MHFNDSARFVKRTASMAVLALLLAGAPFAGIAMADKGGNGGGKGGGKEDPPPTEPEPILDESTIHFCVKFRNAVGDKIQRDGLLSGSYQYCHGADDFRASTGGQIGNSNLLTTPSQGQE